MKDFLLIISAIIIFIYTINSYAETKNSEIKLENSISVADKSFFAPPQKIAVNLQKEKIEINTKNIEIEKIYSYEISGRVAKSFNYNLPLGGIQVPSTAVCIVWNDLVTDDNISNIEFRTRLSGGVSWSVQNGAWLNEKGGINSINNSISLNYAIATTEETATLLNKIEENDLIKLKGYLINIKSNTSTMETSTSFDDGYAEYIYVEDVKWIK